LMPLLKHVGIDIEEIEGVGKVTAQKLRQHGIYYAEDILSYNVKELAEIVGSEDMAEKIFRNTLKLLEQQEVYKHFITAEELYMLRQSSYKRFTTGVKALDTLLGGGIETKAIYEFVGEFGAGKTNLCHQLSVTVQLPEDKGGLKAKAFYIDTEGTFRPERIMKIAKRFGLDTKEVLKNIFYSRVYNTDHLFMVLSEVRSMIRKENIKLVIVDSIIAHFRAEYPGRENLAERQQRLNMALNILKNIADIDECAVVITNQVLANPGGYFGDAIKPAGGHVLAHASTYRIWLRKSKENIRVAKIFDSPMHPEREVQFKITDEGLVDMSTSEGKESKKGGD